MKIQNVLTIAGLAILVSAGSAFGQATNESRWESYTGTRNAYSNTQVHGTSRTITDTTTLKLDGDSTDLRFDGAKFTGGAWSAGGNTAAASGQGGPSFTAGLSNRVTTIDNLNIKSTSSTSEELEVRGSADFYSIY